MKQMDNVVTVMVRGKVKGSIMEIAIFPAWKLLEILVS